MTLVGSVAEGTRVGMGNEVDLTVDFHGWAEHAFSVLPGDPFNLVLAASDGPEWIKPYLNTIGQERLLKCLYKLS